MKLRKTTSHNSNATSPRNVQHDEDAKITGSVLRAGHKVQPTSLTDRQRQYEAFPRLWGERRSLGNLL